MGLQSTQPRHRQLSQHMLVSDHLLVCMSNRQVMTGACPAGFEDYIPKNHPRLTAPMMPEGGSVYNYTFNKDKAEWQTWSDTLAPPAIPAGADFSDIIVPTQDSARYTFLLDTALRHAQPILFVGPTGGVTDYACWLWSLSTEFPIEFPHLRTCEAEHAVANTILSADICTRQHKYWSTLFVTF